MLSARYCPKHFTLVGLFNLPSTRTQGLLLSYPHTSEETEAQRGAGTCPGPTAGEGGAETGVLVQPGPYFPLTRVRFLLQPAAWRDLPSCQLPGGSRI